MREWGGDIWDRFRRSWIVIPTNIGWKSSKTGKPGANVMGAGVALEATKRVPGLAELYGQYCSTHHADSEVTIDLTSALVLFPTKPLNEQNPALSWKNKSTLELVAKSARELAQAAWICRKTIEQLSLPEENQPQLEDDDVYLPYVGCGSGGLSSKQVLPLLHSILSDRFVLVHYQPF